MTSVLSSYKQKDRGSGYFVQIVSGTHQTVLIPPPTVYTVTTGSENMADFSTPSAPGANGTTATYAAGALFKDIGREVYIYGPDVDPLITSPVRLQAIWREVYPVNQGEIPAVATVWIKVFSAANPASITVVRTG